MYINFVSRVHTLVLVLQYQSNTIYNFLLNITVLHTINKCILSFNMLHCFITCPMHHLIHDKLTLNMSVDVCYCHFQIGINHGLTAAYVGHHYAGPGNHFCKQQLSHCTLYNHWHTTLFCSMNQIFIRNAEFCIFILSIDTMHL